MDVGCESSDELTLTDFWLPAGVCCKQNSWLLHVTDLFLGAAVRAQKMTYVNLWQLMTAYNIFWQLLTALTALTAFDNHWQPLTAFDSLWQLSTFFHIFWQLLSAFDSFCQLLTAYIIFWQLSTSNDSFWQLMTVNDSLWQLLKANLSEQLTRTLQCLFSGGQFGPYIGQITFRTPNSKY